MAPTGFTPLRWPISTDRLQPVNPSAARTLLPPCRRVKIPSLRKPLRNSLILRHGVLTKLRLSRPPRCVAARSPLSPRSHALTLLVLLRLFLRVSAAPRQNHPLVARDPLPRFPIPIHHVVVVAKSSALPLRSLRLRVKSPPSLSKTLRSHFRFV